MFLLHTYLVTVALHDHDNVYEISNNGTNTLLCNVKLKNINILERRKMSIS
jgi:hypothetical protein